VRHIKCVSYLRILHRRENGRRTYPYIEDRQHASLNDSRSKQSLKRRFGGPETLGDVRQQKLDRGPLTRDLGGTHHSIHRNALKQFHGPRNAVPARSSPTLTPLALKFNYPFHDPCGLYQPVPRKSPWDLLRLE